MFSSPAATGATPISRVFCAPEGWTRARRGWKSAALEGVSHAPLAAAAEADWVLLNSPVKCELAERPFGLGELLSRLRPGARLVFLGPGAPPAGLEGFETFDLMADEAFLRRNAVLTAEGALFAAMRAQERALRDCDCLVIGWGRIGRALTEMLVALGARVTVASRAERSRRQAQERGAQAVETAALSGALSGKRLDLFHAALPGLAGSGTGARRPGRLYHRPFQPALRRGRGGGAPPRPARVARTGPAGTLLPGERGAGHRRGV